LFQTQNKNYIVGIDSSCPIQKKNVQTQLFLEPIMSVLNTRICTKLPTVMMTSV
jgi:hypothetical protein